MQLNTSYFLSFCFYIVDSGGCGPLNVMHKTMEVFVCCNIYEYCIAFIVRFFSWSGTLGFEANDCDSNLLFPL